MHKITCTVHEISPLTSGITKVLLTPKEPVTYLPGQYLQICLSESDKRPFSIASIPSQEHLELHIGGSTTDQYTSQALAHLQENHEIIAEVGSGEAYWRKESSRPIILLAGGTGFSYVYSLAKAIKEAGKDHEVHLYWGVREEDALYHVDELSLWAKSQPGFHFIPVVQTPSPAWQGRTGLVHDSILADFASLAKYDVYLAGPFSMAAAVREAFLAQGAIKEQLFADAYAYI